MVLNDSLCRAEGFESVYTHLVEDVSLYYDDFSQEEKDRIFKGLYFLSRHSKDTFYQRVYIINILLRTHPDVDTILACLFVPLHNEGFSDEEVLEYAGSESFHLLQEVVRVSTILYQGEKNAGVIQRYLLSQVDDVRVIYIRIAKRIGLLQKMYYGDLILPKRKRQRYIKGALAIGVPLLAQLGIYSLKTLLEDVCFALRYPEKLAEIKENLERTKEAREKIISYIEDELSLLLSIKNIPFLKISGRNKGFASIAKKVEKKEYSSLEEVTDVLAIRIIVETEADCYAVLGELHSHKEFLESHFKDYIASPKVNGYQTIHTLLVGLLDDNTPVEIQIRSREMDLHAEMGSASHWSYKGGESIIKPKNEIPDFSGVHMDRFHRIKASLPPKIYPITPTGEIKELPAGSTPVDFAYSIHSDIGDHCSGALVNEKIFPLSGKLQTGDMVGIFTDKKKTPNPGWLDFVASSSAKQKIRLFLNIHEDEFAVGAHHAKKEEFLRKHSEKKEKELKSTHRKKLEEAKRLLENAKKDPHLGIVIGGEKGIPHHFAKCCCPEENPHIVAYSSSTRDFVIHAQHCGNLKNLDQNRLIEAHWES